MRHHAVLTSTVFLLCACGGGGGDGGSSASVEQGPVVPQNAVVLTLQNFAKISHEVLDTSRNVSLITTVLPSSVATAGGSGGELGAAHSLLARQLPAIVKALAAPAEPIGTNESDTSTCSGGGSITVASENNNTAATVTYSKCVESGRTTNGVLHMRNIKDLSQTRMQADMTVDLVFTESTNSSMRMRWTIALDADVSPTRVNLSYTGDRMFLESNLEGVNEVISFKDFKFKVFADTQSNGSVEGGALVASTALAGQIRMDIAPAMTKRGSAFRPHEGTITISDRAGSKVVITILGDEKFEGDPLIFDADLKGQPDLITQSAEKWPPLHVDY